MLVVHNAVIMERAHGSRVWRVAFVYGDFGISIDPARERFDSFMFIRTIGSCTARIYLTKTLI